MRPCRFVCALLYIAVLAAIALPAVSADKPGGAPPTPPPAMSPEEQAMMEKWMAFATPGEAHKVLDAKVGTWSTVVKMWLKPDSPVQESAGTSTLAWIMDGRYLKDTTEGMFEGQPFHGNGLAGYDNMKKKYVATWIDNMGTGISTVEGKYNPATKSFTYMGEMPDPMAGKYVSVRSVETMLGPDKWSMETYTKGPDGKEFKCMEIVYTRKK